MQEQENNFIQVNGIMSKGYGFAPQVVMRDLRLSPEAKCIYSYMSSFAGSGLTAFPTIKLQLHELGMGEKRYYKHRKMLEDLGYITIKRTRFKKDNGKVVGGKNIYTLEQFPIEKTSNESANSEPSQNDSVEENGLNTNFSEPSQNESVQNESVQNDGTKSNNVKSNNVKSNISLTSSSTEDDDEVKKIMQICQLQEYKLKKKDVLALLLVYDFTKISKAIITATSIDTEIKNPTGYLVSILNDFDKVKSTNITLSKNNKNTFNDFTQRNYDEDYYDNLEKQLL